MSKWHTTEFCENCAKEFCCTDECKYHLLHQIREAREEIENIDPVYSTIGDRIPVLKNCDDIKGEVLTILDKLIESEEK